LHDSEGTSVAARGSTLISTFLWLIVHIRNGDEALLVTKSSLAEFRGGKQIAVLGKLPAYGFLL